MRTLLYITCLTFACSCSSLSRNTERVTGLLLLSSWRTDNSFDLFLPCSIDTLKTLKENIFNIEKDTAYCISIGQIAFSTHAVRLRNEAVENDLAEETKYTIVIAITAEYDRELEKRMRSIEGNDVVRLPYTFDNRTITEFYSTKQVFLKNIQVISL